MNRNITNIIRFCMDELLPPIIRDNKYFMYPFFYYAFKGKNIKTMMEFKSMAGKMSTEEYEDIYKNLDTLGARRPTDLNSSCIRYILNKIEKEDKKIIDVGCGRGYFVELLLRKFPEKEIWGADLLQDLEIPKLNYIQGNIENLPLENKSMDVVVCSHVLEHVLDFDKTLKELKRIARKKIIITVPKQRYYYYTLDLHLHFFYKEFELIEAMKMENFEIKNLQGDFVFVGYL
ncbi:MAG TPA: class I SAM-dependent methyltransferase [Chitinophagaceae bacterium]|nr:class I SAM-dependent methyltransferase [Chitinophagaceae bacterium]